MKYIMNGPRSGKAKLLSVLVTALVAVGCQQSALTLRAEKVFQEVGGLVVIQAESGPLISPWVNGTAKAGYTGSSYRTWAGADVTQWPSPSEDFPYVFKINITRPGKYNFRAYNWTIRDYASYFMQLDGAATHDHYFTYKSPQKWSWITWRDTGTNHVLPSFYLAAGIHTIAFKGRTGNSGYLIDRFHLYMDSVSNPLSLSLPESPYTGGTASPPPPTSGTLTTINDDSTRVTYGGTWYNNNSAPNRINNDEHYVANTGASAQFTFVGTQITWVATKFSNRGRADVYLDGVLKTTVDQYSAGVLYQQPVYVKTGLSAASHTIRIVCKGTKTASSTGTFIDVDAFKYQ
jgi:hypothetical protein